MNSCPLEDEVAGTIVLEMSLLRLILHGPTALQNLRLANGSWLEMRKKRELPSSLGQPTGEDLVRVSIGLLVRASIRALLRDRISEVTEALARVGSGYKLRTRQRLL